MGYRPMGRVRRMPKVPVYQSQVQSQSIRAPEFRSGNPGVNTGEDKVFGAIKNVIGSASDVYDKEKQRSMEVNVLAAKKKLTELENEIQYNNEFGYKTKSGKQAGEAIGDINQRWASATGKMLDDLTDPREKFAFERELQSRWGYISKDMTSHAFNESRKYDAALSESFVSNEQNTAIANYKDMDRVRLSINNQRKEIYEFGKRNGANDESIKQNMDSATSRTNFMVLSQMLNNNDDQSARKYFDENKENFVGKDLISAQKAIEAGSLRGESQRESDRIIGMGLSESQSLAEARKIIDPEKRDEVNRRIKNRFREQQMANAEAREHIFMQSYNSVEKTMNLDSIPPQRWSVLSPSQRDTIKRLASGKSVETDIHTYYDLEQMAAAPGTRDRFAKLDLTDYSNKLNKSDFQKLSKIQANLRKGDSSAADDIKFNRTRLDGFLAEYGYTLDKKNPSKTKEYNEAYDAAFKRLEILAKESGKNRIPDDEAKRVVDGIMMDVVTKKGFIPFFDTKKKLFQLEPDEKIDLNARDVPEQEKKKIVDALKRNNIEATDQEILRLYTNKLKKAKGNGI